VAQNADKPAAHDLIFMVRTQRDALSAVPSVQQAIWRVDKNLATYDVAAMVIIILRRSTGSGWRRALWLFLARLDCCLRRWEFME
jgi:hypothetical protein